MHITKNDAAREFAEHVRPHYRAIRGRGRYWWYIWADWPVPGNFRWSNVSPEAITSQARAFLKSRGENCNPAAVRELVQHARHELTTGTMPKEAITRSEGAKERA